MLCVKFQNPTRTSWEDMSIFVKISHFLLKIAKRPYKNIAWGPKTTLLRQVAQICFILELICMLTNVMDEKNDFQSCTKCFPSKKKIDVALYTG